MILTILLLSLLLLPYVLFFSFIICAFNVLLLLLLFQYWYVHTHSVIDIYGKYVLFQSIKKDNATTGPSNNPGR